MGNWNIKKKQNIYIQNKVVQCIPETSVDVSVVTMFKIPVYTVIPMVARLLSVTVRI